MSDVPGQQGAKDRSAADDPAPYAWLDDDNRMAGTIAPGATMVFGAFFLVTATASAVAAVATQHLPGLWFAFAFALLGAQLLRMGPARRAWRVRHPGIDPCRASRVRRAGRSSGPTPAPEPWVVQYYWSSASWSVSCSSSPRSSRFLPVRAPRSVPSWFWCSSRRSSSLWAGTTCAGSFSCAQRVGTMARPDGHGPPAPRAPMDPRRGGTAQLSFMVDAPDHPPSRRHAQLAGQ